MRHEARITHPLRTALLAVGGAAVLALAVPAASASATWSASSHVAAGATDTGSLGIDDDVLTGGSWTDQDGATFDPSSGTLDAGETLVYTVPAVDVTAVGENLTASFDVSGAQVPAEIADHVTVGLAADGAGTTDVHGADSDDAGHQTVDLALSVAADDGLPATAQTVDLSGLTVTLGNGHRWSDTSSLDAGTVTTGTPTPDTTVNLRYDLTLDADREIGFYLDDPAPGTTVSWNTYVPGTGTEVTTEAVDGYNSYDYTGDPQRTTVQVTIRGSFAGMGSPEQTVAQIGALRQVSGWTTDVGSTDASYAFSNAVHLNNVDALPATLTDTSYTFRNAGSQLDPTLPESALTIAQWDSSHVTTMDHMFDGATNYHPHALSLDTSSVTSMDAMFKGATSFNAIVGDWDTSHVTRFSSMFSGATSFDQDLSGWDTSAATNMSNMFRGATAFDRDIGGWDTGNATTMQQMFAGAASFDQDLSGWDVAKVTNHKNFSDGAPLTDDHLPLWADAQALAERAEDPAAATDDPTSDGADDAQDPVAEPTDAPAGDSTDDAVDAVDAVDATPDQDDAAADTGGASAEDAPGDATDTTAPAPAQQPSPTPSEVERP